MTKVVWFSNETSYSYSEFVAPNIPYFINIDITPDICTVINVGSGL